MKRRQFLAGLAALPLTSARAQAPVRGGKLPRVGIYLTSPPEAMKRYVNVFVEGMRELGWIEGNNVVYERAYATTNLVSPNDDEKIIALAKTLVDRKPDVIWLASSSNAQAVLKVTRTIPVVGSAVSEVVERGLAKSMSRPGGNFTGISNFAWELGVKRFEFLRDMMPKLTRVGLLMQPSNPNCVRELKAIEAAAAPVGVTVIRAVMERADDVDDAFAHLAKNRAEAVLIAHAPIFQNYRKAILRRAADQGIPAVGHRTFFAEDGALLAYSTILEEQMRRSAHLVDKILKGTHPGEIPVEQPTKFELVINRRAAKRLGLTIPESLLVQARIIE